MPFLKAKAVLLDSAFQHDQPAQAHTSDVQTHRQSGRADWLGRGAWRWCTASVRNCTTCLYRLVVPTATGLMLEPLRGLGAGCWPDADPQLTSQAGRSAHRSDLSGPAQLLLRPGGGVSGLSPGHTPRAPDRLSHAQAVSHAGAPDMAQIHTRPTARQPAAINRTKGGAGQKARRLV